MSKEVPEKGLNLRTYNFFVNDEHFKVEVEEVGGPMIVAAAAPAAAPAAKPAPAKKAAPAPVAADVDGTPIAAPMPGLIVSIEKKVGDAVSEGETVVVLEAMKMENALPAPASGTIKAVNCDTGDNVGKGDVLVVIG